MKKISLILIAVLAILSAVLLIFSVVSSSRSAELKKDAAETIFYALHTLDERIGYSASSGNYTVRDSETVCRVLTEIEIAVVLTEKLYASTFFTGSRSFLRLADALGNSYAATVNGTAVESILYRRTITENELQFIKLLASDIELLLDPMLADDHLNIRDDLTYDEIREPLEQFIQKWGQWSQTTGAPYALLNSEN